MRYTGPLRAASCGTVRSDESKDGEVLVSIGSELWLDLFCLSEQCPSRLWR